MDSSHSPQVPSLLEQAIGIAIRAHSGQMYKNVEPYILHPLRLMLRMDSLHEQLTAVLHDVLEDGCACDLETLRAFPAEVSEAVCVLTRESDENDYEAYIRRVGINPLARRIKIKDLEDHLHIRRNRVLEEADFRKQQRYLRAHQYLCGLERGACSLLSV